MAAARGAIRRLATAVDAAPSVPTKRWTREQVQKIYEAPLMDLMFRAATVHRQHHDPNKIQLCTLLNIK
jgi:biotin synthase